MCYWRRNRWWVALENLTRTQSRSPGGEEVCVCVGEREELFTRVLGVGCLIPKAFTTDRALNTGSQCSPDWNPPQDHHHPPSPSHTCAHQTPHTLPHLRGAAAVNQHLPVTPTHPAPTHTLSTSPNHQRHPNFCHKRLLSVSGEYLPPFSTFPT